MTATISRFSESIQDQENQNRPESDRIRRGWHRTHSGPFVIQNEKLGVHIVWVCWRDAGGVFKYDQILRAERPGTLFLPVDREGNIGLQKTFRPQAADQERYAKHFPHFPLSDLGRVSYEIPRGFAKRNESARAMTSREVEEETGARMLSYHKLPSICDNTAFSPHLTHVGWGEIDLDQPSGAPEDPLEQILQKVQFFTQSEITTLMAAGELYCGYTLAAIGSYFLMGR